MTAIDLALLRLRLDQLTVVDLHSLDDVSLISLPPLQHLTRRRALSEIVNALQEIKSRRQRLHSVALLHCWFLQRHSISPWTMFRFKRLSELTDFRRVLMRLASMLSSRAYDVGAAWTVDGGTVYACLLIQDIEHVLIAEHQVSYVVVWPGLPLLAIHVPNNRAKRCVLSALDAVFHGASAELLAVPPGGLGAALRASFPHLSLKVMESALNVPEVARDADQPAPQGDREKRRLEKWHAALAELGSALRPVDDKYTVTDGRGTWVHFEGPGLLEKLRKLYVNGADEVISARMLPAFLGRHHHVVENSSE